MFSSHSYELTNELDKFTNTKDNTLKLSCILENSIENK